MKVLIATHNLKKKAELQRISAVRDREKQTDQGVTEVQLHRKEWLRKRGYRT